MFGLCGRDHSDLGVQAAVVEPVEVFREGELKVVKSSPGSAVADEFGFDEGVERFRHRVVVGVAAGAYGRDGGRVLAK